ncbi:MAG TPA: PKD domain-containing protein [Chitinophagaceae bacterium]|nr:PKD domain-containing protein [Chitinophagaceae bacterium]
MESLSQFTSVRCAVVLSSVIMFIACKKESVPAGNKAPMAFAGKDTVIFYPADSAELRGSGTDPDGTITRYAWQQSSGPTDALIENPNADVTQVKWLAIGVYQFELKVTDNKGLSGKATVQVTVDF